MLLQSWANANFIWENPNPATFDIPPIPRCYGEGCTTLAFAVNGDDHPYVQHTIDHVIKVNNLTAADVKRWDTSLE
jgi:hypothetical protein